MTELDLWIIGFVVIIGSMVAAEIYDAAVRMRRKVRRLTGPRVRTTIIQGGK